MDILQKRKLEILETFKNLHAELEEIEFKMRRIQFEEKKIASVKDKEERTDAYERFLKGDDSVYEIYLQKIQSEKSFTVKRGRKWDIFSLRNNQCFKVDYSISWHF